MKKLLSLLSVLIINRSITIIIIAARFYQKKENKLENNKIISNNLKIINLKYFNKHK